MKKQKKDFIIYLLGIVIIFAISRLFIMLGGYLNQEPVIFSLHGVSIVIIGFLMGLLFAKDKIVSIFKSKGKKKKASWPYIVLCSILLVLVLSPFLSLIVLTNLLLTISINYTSLLPGGAAISMAVTCIMLGFFLPSCVETEQ